MAFQDSKNKSTQILIIDDVRFYRNRLRGTKQYWKCSQYYKPCRCPAIAICNLASNNVQRMYKHNHNEEQGVSAAPAVVVEVVE